MTATSSSSLAGARRWKAPLSRGLAALGEVLGDLVFPWACERCGDQGPGLSGPFCDDCRRELLHAAARFGTDACPRCALPAGPDANVRKGCSKCRGVSLGHDAAVALGVYEGVLRELCLRLKREPEAWLAPWMGRLLAESLAQDRARWPEGSWIVPVPLHWWRRLRRGYNQAESIAEGLGRSLGLPVRRPLRRVKATDKLASMKARERAQAMRGVFRASASGHLKGRTILLVDDIMTTGATAGAAARALKHAGARRIEVFVLARTL